MGDWTYYPGGGANAMKIALVSTTVDIAPSSSEIATKRLVASPPTIPCVRHT